jgi:hypothetical protein
MIGFFNNKHNNDSDDTIPSYEDFVKIAEEKCMDLQQSDSAFAHLGLDYSMEVTKEELGLDDELINSLLEDFVAQIIRNLPIFRSLAKQYYEESLVENEIDPTPLYDLTHKNLGVARNLRIENAKAILEKMMKEKDFMKILYYIDYLESCVILLKPKIAYKAFFG